MGLRACSRPGNEHHERTRMAIAERDMSLTFLKGMTVLQWAPSHEDVLAGAIGKVCKLRLYLIWMGSVWMLAGGRRLG